MPKIYCWVNSGRGTDWQIVIAMAEDGTALASHCSSSEGWAKHDIGIGSDWKHDTYRKHYPEGFELEWVDDFDGHPGLAAAYEKNQARKAAREATEAERVAAEHERMADTRRAPETTS